MCTVDDRDMYPHMKTDFPIFHPKSKNPQGSMMKGIKTVKMYQQEAAKNQNFRIVCLQAKPIFTPGTSDEFWRSARRQGNYGASLHTCCGRVSMPPFNCPPMLLTSSRTSQLISNRLDIVFGGRLV